MAEGDWGISEELTLESSLETDFLPFRVFAFSAFGEFFGLCFPPSSFDLFRLFFDSRCFCKVFSTSGYLYKKIYIS